MQKTNWCAAALVLLVAFSLRAETVRTQQITLTRGWNAVFLEVYPENSDPAAVFAGTPVDIAASHFARGGSAQFVSEPGADMFKKAGWGVWYAEARPEAFLKSLHAILGQQAYLVHSKTDFTWQVSGAVTMAEVRWQPNAYNLVGFGVHAQAAPTFSQFFAGSKAHRHNKIYRLQNGAWRRVNDPSAEAMKSGEAFWIYCQADSTYQGPLRIETTARQGVVLSTGTDGITCRNQTTHPISPTLEHVVSGSNSVPLALLVQVTGAAEASVSSRAAALPDGSWSQPLPPLEPQVSLRVPLQLRQRDAGVAAQSSLLKITTDLGTEVWIPVFGIRNDLQAN